MRIRARLFLLLLAVTAMSLGGVGGASAATLFTSTTHTTRVTAGATADLVAISPIVFTSATTVINSCNNGTLHVVIDQNTDAAVIATVTAGTLTNCSPAPYTPTFGTPWRLSITGSGTTVAPNVQWPATLSNFAFDVLNGVYTGNLTTGVTAFQSEPRTSPVCLRLADSGEFSGPLTGNGRIDATFCFEGAAGSWSLTN
jgi:hypothetical protein